MENVVLTIHLILALLLVGIVLLQRSEGGGLGMGGGGNNPAGRSATTALQKLTWLLAAAFIVTSLTLTILAARGADSGSVIDQIGAEQPADGPASLPAGSELLPPAPTDAPLAPPPADAPATPPAASE
ncbi:MAG: preprotein translocase subunit SecG [Rhodobacteraceae bacterium]|nr:preprotein translocase subunit SecG [Paracoccaceae bacterium]MCZ8082921.1 preprotein translocase subunit SecG [Paracoccaceae bacterium]